MVRGTRGFTILELLVTLAIAAIVAGLGGPSFQTLMEKNRLRTTTDDLLELLRISRLEAVEQRRPVQVCGSTDGETCDAGGWSDYVLMVKPAQGAEPREVVATLNVNPRVTILKNNVNSDEIDFTATGWIPGDPATFDICPVNGDRQHAYQLVISMSGKTRKVLPPIADSNCPA